MWYFFFSVPEVSELSESLTSEINKISGQVLVEISFEVSLSLQFIISARGT